jgi:hypothetical protein
MEDVLEQPVEELEVPAAEPVEGEQPETEVVEAEPKEGEPGFDKTPVTSLFTADGKSLDPTIRNIIDRIKAENSSAAKVIGKSLFRLAELDREFPRGLTEVRELREQVEKLGGVDGLKQKAEDAQLFDTLSGQYLNADPAFVADMVKASQESFVTLAPLIMEEFAKASPETFAAHVGRVIYADLQRNEIPLLMARFADVLGDNPKALEYFQQINSYLGGFRTLASTEIKPPKPKAAEDKPSGAETTNVAQQWESEAATGRATIAVGEFKRLTAGKTLSGDNRAEIEEFFRARSKVLATKYFPNWTQTAQDYLKAGQKSSYLRLMASIDRRVVPEAVQYAVGKVVRPGTSGAKPTATVVKPVAKGATPVNGYKFVGKMPATDQIDWFHTGPASIKKNQAVLKDGSRVQWR